MTPILTELRSKAAAVLVAGVVVLSASVAPARAQVGLPDSVLNPPGPLDDAGKQSIAAYVNANKAALTGGDVDAIMKARKALVDQLRRSQSNAFRMELANQLLPIIRPLATDSKNEAAINATRLAGELATPDVIPVLAASLKDKRPAIRVVAAGAYQRMIAINSNAATPVLVIRHAQAALKDLDAALQAETEPKVADAIVIAIDAAINADQAKFPGLRGEAVKTLSNAISIKARDAKALTFTAAIGRAADSMFNLVKDTAAVPLELVPDAAGVAGDVLALAARTGCSGLAPDLQRDLEQMLIRAEKTYLYSRKKADGAQPADLKLAESFCASSDKFRKDALTVLGALSDAGGPFKLKDSRFPTK